jgi:hypothetical protein
MQSFHRWCSTQSRLFREEDRKTFKKIAKKQKKLQMENSCQLVFVILFVPNSIELNLSLHNVTVPPMFLLFSLNFLHLLQIYRLGSSV